jgi:hypothetical protein
MKTLLALCLLFAAAIHANDGTPPAPEGKEARFVVVSGPIDHGNGAVPTFVRMDTHTGKTWMLHQVPMPGGGGAMMHIWLPCQEIGSDLYNLAIKGTDK